MAYRYTQRLDVAEELTQDTFLKVYQNLSSFSPSTGSLRNWIMRVGRNLMIDHYRSTRREKYTGGSDEIEAGDFGDLSPQVDPFHTVYHQEKADFIMKGLDSLAPELKEAVILRDIQGFSYREMTEILQIPEGTVKSRINRGRIGLAKWIGQQQFELDLVR